MLGAYQTRVELTSPPADGRGRARTGGPTGGGSFTLLENSPSAGICSDLLQHMEATSGVKVLRPTYILHCNFVTDIE